MSDEYKTGAASLFAIATRLSKSVMPEYALACLMSSFDGTTAEVIAVRFGEQGYYPTTFGRQTREWIAEQNQLMGIDPAAAAAYSICSLSGSWGRYEDVLVHMQDALLKKNRSAHWIGGE